MRLCENETVRVYETEGNDLPALLREAAETLEELDGDYAFADLKVSVMQEDVDYLLTMGVH